MLTILIFLVKGRQVYWLPSALISCQEPPAAKRTTLACIGSLSPAPEIHCLMWSGAAKSLDLAVFLIFANFSECEDIFYLFLTNKINISDPYFSNMYIHIRYLYIPYVIFKSGQLAS